MVTPWRWLLAAAMVPLVLAGCTSSAGRRTPGPAGRPALPASAAPTGKRHKDDHQDRDPPLDTARANDTREATGNT